MRDDVEVDVGDDCALTRVPPGFSLAVTVDTLVSGVHFFPDCDPQALGHKALAVSLSDLAAAGAQPAWATLALTLPNADAAWIEAFARGLHDLASQFALRLIGGDLTRGPLSITIQAMGLVRTGTALGRGGARPGDQILVSGEIGDAALALELLRKQRDSRADTGEIPDALRARLERPTPRVALGGGLRGLASSAIDISDGLLADLGHLLEANNLGAEVQLTALPLSRPVAAWITNQRDWALPLTGGDDYELCFTVPKLKLPTVLALADGLDCPVTVIGRITERPGLQLEYPDGRILKADDLVHCRAGYDHFRELPRNHSHD